MNCAQAKWRPVLATALVIPPTLLLAADRYGAPAATRHKHDGHQATLEKALISGLCVPPDVMKSLRPGGLAV